MDRFVESSGDHFLGGNILLCENPVFYSQDPLSRQIVKRFLGEKSLSIAFFRYLFESNSLSSPEYDSLLQWPLVDSALQTDLSAAACQTWEELRLGKGGIQAGDLGLVPTELGSRYDLVQR